LEEILSEAEWFIVQDGKQIGPVTAVQLKAMCIAGTLKTSDLIWADGMKDWELASKLFEYMAKPPPMLPTDAQAAPPCYSDQNLQIENGKVQLGGKAFPLQMVREVSVTTHSMALGILCIVIGVLLLIPGLVDIFDIHRGAADSAKVFLPLGGMTLTVGFFNLWVTLSNFLLKVHLHSGGFVKLQSKDRGYLETLARTIKSASMS
jgi:hypothetical protein